MIYHCMTKAGEPAVDETVLAYFERQDEGHVLDVADATECPVISVDLTCHRLHRRGELRHRGSGVYARDDEAWR